MTIRDAELRGVEIPAPEPALGAAGVIFALMLPMPGQQRTPRKALALTHASLASPWHPEVALYKTDRAGAIDETFPKWGSNGENTMEVLRL